MASFGRFFRFISVVILGVLVLLPSNLMSCPVCYGNVETPMTAGMNMAIFTLLGVTGAVLSLFTMFFLHLRKNARNSVAK